MKIQVVLSCIILILFSFWSCRRDSDITIIEEYAASSVNGFVSNEENLAVNRAEVTINGKTFLTDNFGYFNAENISHNGKIVIQVKGNGYFDGSRTLFTRSKEKIFTQIQLIKENYPYKLVSTMGGIIEVDDAVKLDFPPNAFVDKNGKDFDGIVATGVKYLDPTLQTTYNEMPGALIGQTQNEEDVILESYGMVGVWLVDANGNSLNIKQGVKCKMSVKIPTTMLSYAPDVMPLWHFDEDKGVWVEEGTAIKKDNQYEGEVAHFSYWNCDYPRPVVYIKGKLVLRSGTPTNGMVSVKIEGQSGQRMAHANALGEFEGLVPANELLEMTVYDYCNEIILNQRFGPFVTDQDLGNIIVKNKNSDITISGIVLGCDGQPSPNAGIYLNYENQRDDYITDEFGKFSITKQNCKSSTFEIKAISNKDAKESEIIYLSSSMDNRNLILNACIKDLDEFIFMNFSNGEKFVISQNISGYEALSINSEGRIMIKFLEKAKVNSPIKSSFYFENGIFKFITPENSSSGVTKFTKLVTDFKDSKNYNEGGFQISNITKYSVQAGIEVPVETGLTATGTFRYKND
jgi:hypothetical protein